MTKLHTDDALPPVRRKVGRLRIRLVQLLLVCGALVVIDERFLGGSILTQAALEAESQIRAGQYLFRRTMERLRIPS